MAAAPKRVLVTGGTGMLGAELVPHLADRGHDAMAFSRRASGPGTVTGDVLTGDGLASAAAGCDAIVHAATSPRRRMQATEVEGTRNVLQAAIQAGVAHVIYVSIVGVDRHRFIYYRAKWAAEQVVEAHGGGWSILRATQFHDLLDMFLGFPVFPATRRMPFQPIDVGEVAARLADLVEEGPGGRVPDIGGPEVLTIRQLRDARREITGRKARLVPAPRLGFLRDFDDGLHLAPGHEHGRITWSEWLLRSGSANQLG